MSVNMNNSNLSENLDHPWSYLTSMFKIKAIEDKSVVAICLLCSPKYTECRSYINSPSNLKKHVKRVHPQDVSKYDELTSCARKRKRDTDDNIVNRMMQQQQQQVEECFPNSDLMTQEKVDQLIMNFVVGGLLPMQIVELPEFLDLIDGLQPNSRVMTGEALHQTITEHAAQKKLKLIEVLQEQKYVATTTNCWSSLGKSYIGVTVHWIDRVSLKHKSAYLSLRILNEPHTCDILAAVLKDIHTEFCIQRKLVRTTTDNGSNFVKAFSLFGQLDDQDEDLEEDSDLLNKKEVEMLNTYDTLKTNEIDVFELPKYQRCACYNLNLVCTTDADKAESDLEYRKLSRSAFAKCQHLWNKYGRSLHSKDDIEPFKLGLKKPNQTRWNSVYMAVERLTQLIQIHGMDQFDFLCNRLEVPRLTSVEVAFLGDYVSVMKYIVQSLNILQSEKRMYMAYLLPTITRLRENLVGMQNVAINCRPLLTALISGIDDRFSKLFDDSEAIAATILHPKFRTGWTDNQAVLDRGLRYIRHHLSAIQQSASLSIDQACCASDDDDREFFAMKRTVLPGRHSLDQYLETTSKDIQSIATWPDLKELFVHINTPLPASAAVEILFGSTGLIMTNKRTGMSDKQFENLVLCKLNKWLEV